MTLATAPVERVLARLTRVTENGHGWHACCPAHEDHARALHVAVDRDGRVRLRCARGCTARQIVERLQLAAADLAPSAPPADARFEVAQRAVRDQAAAEGRPVLLCDGRDVAHALADEGYTTAWLDLANESQLTAVVRSFAGLPEVIVVPNGGVRSRVWAEAAATHLVSAGVPVRVVQLPSLDRSQTAADWIAARPDDGLDAFDAAIDAAPVWRPEDGARPAPSKFTVLTDQELEQLPPPAWLWEGLIPVGALAALIGPPGAGKSFIALDLAASVAVGRSALGRPALAGTALYVAAEGTAGLPQRLAAWKHAHGHVGRSIPVHFITQGVNLFAAGDDAQLIAACHQITRPDRPVRLVILDTLARVMPGGEENSAKDVGLVIEHAERIRRATGATVLIVHHTAKASDQERGSSALRGAMDTILLLKTDDPDAAAGAKLLVTDKQKDAAPAETIVFTLDPVAADTAHGRVTSCRVSLSAVRWTDAPDDTNAPLTRTQLDALRVLRDVFATGGATATEWMDATGIAKRTFYRARAALERAGLVLTGHGRGARYQVTEQGRETLRNPLGAIGATSLPPDGATGGDSQPLKGAVRSPSPTGGAGGRQLAANTRRDPPAWWDREFSDDEVPG